MLRRDFLSGGAAALGFSATILPLGQAKNVLEYGARPDGKTLNTPFIQHAIDDANRAEGGVVCIPAGTFLTGRIDLKSRVCLSLQPGAMLLGSTSLDDYRGAVSSADPGQSHLIYARDAEDVAIIGAGRIDGQGPNFWEPSGWAPLSPEQQWADVASHALKPKAGHPSPMIRFTNCRRVRVEGVRLENSPGWTLHLLNCDDVQVVGISIENPVSGPNTDGIDITGSQNVIVSGCSIATGDDAICLKSENPLGWEPRLVRNIVVTGCMLTTCCNGFKLGTSSEGGFENIVFSNSIIFSDAAALRARVISGVALEVIDGGWIDGVIVNAIQMQRVRTPIFLRMGNRKQIHNYAQSGLRGVSISDIRATQTVLASSITGLPGYEIRDVRLSNIHVENVLPSHPGWMGQSVPEKPNSYPEARMFGMLPSSGLYVRHARDVRLEDMIFTTAAGEARPSVILDDVDGARVTGMASTPVSGEMSVVQLVNACNVWMSGCRMPSSGGTFVSVEGAGTADVVLSGNDLRAARQPVLLSRDVAAQAVVISGNIMPGAR